MAATQGTVTFVGQSGRTYIKDLYLSDTVNTPANWDGGAGASATSPETVSIPEPCFLSDVSVVTGAAQTKLQLIRNGSGTGDFLRHSLHLNTLPLRPALRVPFAAMDQIGALQIA